MVGWRLFAVAAAGAVISALAVALIRLPPTPRPLVGDAMREACRQRLEVARFMVAAEPTSRRAAYGARLWNAEAMAGDDLNMLCAQAAARVISEVGESALADQPRFAGFPCAAEYQLHELYLRDVEYFPGAAVDAAGMAYMLRGMSMALEWRRPRACAHFLTALRSSAALDWLITPPAHVTQEACRREVDVARAYFDGAGRATDPMIAAAHAGVINDVRIPYEAMLRTAEADDWANCMIAATVVNRAFRRLYADLL